MAASSEPRASLSGVGEGICQLLVTAEQVSEAIRREAAEEAELYLAERRREADALLAASKQQADALLATRRERLEQALATLRSEGREIERRTAELTAALERALDETDVPAEDPPEALDISEPLSASSPVAPVVAEPPRAPVAAVEEEPRDESPAQAPGAGSGQDRQRALIRATQLAVQGADRTTVRETLEREFELEDPSAIVEEILGSE